MTEAARVTARTYQHGSRMARKACHSSRDSRSGRRRAFRRKRSGNFVRTLHGRLDSAGDVACTSGGSDSWLWISEGITYSPRPHLQIHFSLRHQRLDATLDASMILRLTVRLDN